MHALTADGALERAATARLLSLGFSYPDPDTIAAVRMLAHALAGARTEGALTALDEAMAPDALDDLPFAFEELFGGAVPCSPYAASYEADPFRGTRQIAEAEGFYRMCGATTDAPAAERADHIACQLEFVAFTAARAVDARARGATAESARMRDVEDAFMRRHLGRYMAAFCASVAERSTSPIYRALAAVGARFIDDELACRGITIAPIPRRGPSAVEGDEVVCGGAGCALTEITGERRRTGSAAERSA